MPWSVATELALGFRMSAERAHQIGFVNRLVDDVEELVPAALELCDHLLSIPPASLSNTLAVARRLRPQIPDEITELGKKLTSNGNPDDVMEARRAFAEKRKPVWKGA